MMSNQGLDKYSDKNNEQSTKNENANPKPRDNKGKVIPEAEIESVMEVKSVNRAQAISHIKIVRKKAYDKQEQAESQSNPESEEVLKSNMDEETPQMDESEIKSKNMGIVPVKEDEASLTKALPFIEPVMSIEKAVTIREYLRKAMDKVLIRGKHYGNPQRNGKGVWNQDKLLKPGAEVLAGMFGLEPQFIELVKEEDFKNHIYRYKVKCTLIFIKTGMPIGSAIAAGSSQEKSIGGSGGPELWNNTLQRVQKRAFCKAVEFVTGVDEFFINEKTYTP